MRGRRRQFHLVRIVVKITTFTGVLVLEFFLSKYLLIWRDKAKNRGYKVLSCYFSVD